MQFFFILTGHQYDTHMAITKWEKKSLTKAASGLLDVGLEGKKIYNT